MTVLSEPGDSRDRNGLHNEALAMARALRLDMIELLAKLDSDGGVTDTNYTALVAATSALDASGTGTFRA